MDVFILITEMRYIRDLRQTYNISNIAFQLDVHFFSHLVNIIFTFEEKYAYYYRIYYLCRFGSWLYYYYF